MPKTLSLAPSRRASRKGRDNVGGFLGIGSKPVQVPVSSLDMMRDETGTVHGVTSHTKDQLKDLPEHHD
jgi:hypothetical protein